MTEEVKSPDVAEAEKSPDAPSGPEPVKEVLYLCPHAPTARATIGNVEVQAVNGVLRLSPELAAELDKLAVGRGDIKSLFRKVDRAAAEAQALAHMKARRPAAVQGAASSDTDPMHILANHRNEQNSEMMKAQEAEKARKANEEANANKAKAAKTSSPPKPDNKVTRPSGGLLGRLHTKTD